MKKVLALACMAACGLALLADTPAKEKEALQGTWRATEEEKAGEKRPDPSEKSITFEKDAFTIKQKDRVRYKGTFKIDPSKKPKTIDLTLEEPDRLKGKVSLGVYEVKGDTLKWAFGDPDSTDRPKSVDTTKDTKFLLLTMEREKKKKE